MRSSRNLTRRSRDRSQRYSNGEIASQVVLALLLGLHFACGAAEEPALEETGLATGYLDSAPQRIVSLSTQATRFVTELGVGQQLVGVDAESSALPGLGHLPVVDLATAHDLAPDLVLIPDLASLDDATADGLALAGAQLVEFAPHDFEDVFALCRGLGAQLVGIASATLFERRIARPLALVGGISPPRGRLRVVAVVGFEPLELAGGHSFQTDLIEIGGGTSVTHGGNDLRIAMTPARWDEFSPDLVFVMTAVELSDAERGAVRALIPERFRVEFFAFDPQTFWLEEPKQEAERLRVIIASYSGEQSD